MTKLNNNDYKEILEYYNEEIPTSKHLIKLKAEHILASKLCKCIKKLDTTNEAKAIGICTKTVINNKGLIRGEFKCKKKSTIKLKKNKKNITIKNKK
jgi:hypothetical protein